MFELKSSAATTKHELYADIEEQLRNLLAGERDFVANAANMAAVIYHLLPDLNWAGFYLAKEEQLVLGPFQGKPACVRIAIGKGVCGAAAWEQRTIIVPDVNQFPGHIACDGASRSEMVTPLVKDGSLIGVLDLDSPKAARFDEEDQEGCERLVSVLLESTA